MLDFQPSSSDALDDKPAGGSSPTATYESSDGTLVLSACDDGDDITDEVGNPSPRLLEKSPLPPSTKAESRIAHLQPRDVQPVETAPPGAEPAPPPADASEGAPTPSEVREVAERGSPASSASVAPVAEEPPDNMNHMLVVIDDFLNLRWGKLYRSTRRPRSSRRGARATGLVMVA